jgi:DNA-binding SARP family transcriptional activator
VEFQLLGPVRARHDGTAVPLGRRRERCLLAVLLLEVGSVVPAERLIDLLWDGEPSPAARDNLRAHVSRLRQHVDPEGDGRLGVRILGRAGGYLADVPADRIDVHRFRALVAAARTLPEPAQRTARLREALALWRGPLMSDVATDHLRERIGRDLDEARMAAIELAVAEDLAAGRAVEAVVELTALVREHPLREGLRAQLMLALYRCDRAAEALEVFWDGQAVLVTELGIEPGPELRTVHERILARDPDLAALGEHGDGPDQSATAPHNDLPRDVADFTGRDTELLGIVAEQDTSGATVIVAAIDGMAGVGKTALSVRAAHELADRYPDGALFVDLRAHTVGQEPLTPDVALDRLLRSLGVAAARIPDGLDERVALWRAKLASRRLIVLLDNAVSAAQVRPLLPGTPGSLTLITSRRRLTDLESAYHISLDVLPPTEAIDLFARVAGPERAAVEPASVATVVRLCGYLPLAIRVAAARLRGRPTWTVAHLAERLSEGQRRLGELVTGDLSVAAAFTMSYERLNPDQQRMFRLLGLVPAAEFGVHLIAALAGLSPTVAGQIAEDLVDANLVAQPTPGRYRLHDLLREHAAAVAERTEPERERRAAVGRVLDYYLCATAAAMAFVDPRGAAVAVTLDDPPALPTLKDPGEALAWLDLEHANLAVTVHYATEHSWPTRAEQLDHLLHHYVTMRGRSPDILTPAIMRP